jgi:hypothetical protein
MNLTLDRPTIESRATRYPGVRALYNPGTRRYRYIRSCARCGHEREVRNPTARVNLCHSCRFLPGLDLTRWAA